MSLGKLGYFWENLPRRGEKTQTGDEGIIDFNAQIPDGALDLGMSQQELHGTEIAGPTVDECRFGTSKRVRAEKLRSRPIVATQLEPSISPGGHAAVVITTATAPGFLPAALM